MLEMSQVDLTEEHRAQVMRCFKDILSSYFKFDNKDDKNQALNMVDEFLRCYAIKDQRRESYFLAQVAYKNLSNMGLIRKDDI